MTSASKPSLTNEAAEAPDAADRTEAESRQASLRERDLSALVATARFHAIELDRTDLQVATDAVPSPAALVAWVRDAGLWAKAVRLSWTQLVTLDLTAPVVLCLEDGSTAMVASADPAARVVHLRDPEGGPDDPTLAVDEAQMRRIWSGEAILVRPRRETAEAEAPFSIAWLTRLVRLESRILRDVFLASVTLSVLTILPPLVVMAVIDRVITHESLPTLVMVSLMIGVAMVYEALLGFARRQMTLVVGARVDAKLNLHVFRRLLGLPLDFFEREQTGVIIHNTMQINKVREFLTGKLLSTALDLVTLIVLLPLLFFLQPLLTWLVIACGGAMTAIMIGFLPAMRKAVGRWINAETQKSSVLVETIHGIRTVKSLALEPQQRELWDQRSADATRLKLASGNLGNWSQTLVMPLDSFMQRGVLLLGAYLAIQPGSSVEAGGLIAFMMLSGRVAQPLSGLARLMEDLEEVRTATTLVGRVLNRPPERADAAAGLRPRFAGAITFDTIAYSYPNAGAKALDGVSFSVPAGSVIGLVGRSGSGKSTVTRLLQGISRDYQGSIKIDGSDLREINLAHMRRSFGVVLQENFLFRGSVRENILAGRPGLTLTDAVRAARLAGAEEFIERLPNGYETWIEEGSPNLSGGQRQRLAIARALVHDPRLLILDEATSALDPESEALVNANLTRIARGRTMVIVSHRLSSLTECDHILVLDKGRVVDMAPHATLLERCTIYRQLWWQQNRHTVDAPPVAPETAPEAEAGMPADRAASASLARA